VQDNLDHIVFTFNERLNFIDMEGDLQYLELIENFKSSIKIALSIRVGWLSFRIMDEVFKRIFLKKLSENFMPFNFKKGSKQRLQTPL